MKIKFMYEHPESKERLVSREYSINELLDTSEEEIQQDTCHCECQPIGETNVVECNCDDYFEDFELLGNNQDSPELFENVEKEKGG